LKLNLFKIAVDIHIGYLSFEWSSTINGIINFFVSNDPCSSSGDISTNSKT
jgi:hypothetical protein